MPNDPEPPDLYDDEDQIDWDAAPEPGTFTIGLEGHLWRVTRFDELATVLPEKMELIEGKLFWSERHRLGMLGAMLEQVGLVDAVKLAPKELWLEALRRAYD
jgi:hypothetical protein